MNHLKVALYVRVSSLKKIQNSDKYRQNPAAQEALLRKFAKLRGWQVAKVYSDRMSGAKTEKRAGYQALRQDARKGLFKAVVVYALDRFARSVKELVTAFEEFKTLKIDFICYNNPIDTSTPSGTLMFHIFAAFAEFERAIAQERTLMGMEYARINGTRSGREFGRPKRIFRRDEVRSLRKQGLTIREIADRLHLSPMTVQRTCTKTPAKKPA